MKRGYDISVKFAKFRMRIVLVLAALLMVLPAPGFCLGGADVAIFNDTALSGGGAWSIGITHIKSMLASFGCSYEDITPSEINTTADLNRLYKVLVVPGGWAGAYNAEVNQTGLGNIRNFVNKGGGFIGICAGAYFACSSIIWQGVPYDYPLDLFFGAGLGSLGEIIDFYAPTGCPDSEVKTGAKMTSIQTTGYLPGLKTSLSILYFGGPVFLFSEPDSPSVKVVARYILPGSIHDSKPAMIYFPYGAGRVFLSGPHPEVCFSGCQLSDSADNREIIRRVLEEFSRERAAQSLPTLLMILEEES